MLEADRLHAVLDGIVDGQAVLLVGEDEREYQVAAERLPEGVEEGAGLWVRLPPDGTVEIVAVNEGGASQRRKPLRQRLTVLRHRRPGGSLQRPE